MPLIRAGLLLGAAHITGGGLVENPPRAIAPHLRARFDWRAWERPTVFDWLARTGGIEEAEMRRTFNCGIGFLLVVARAAAEPALRRLLEAGETAFVCGDLVAA
jgi:phosphoribosylaminoimidazole (AIR) synthetase